MFIQLSALNIPHTCDTIMSFYEDDSMRYLLQSHMKDSYVGCFRYLYRMKTTSITNTIVREFIIVQDGASGGGTEVEGVPSFRTFLATNCSPIGDCCFLESLLLRTSINLDNSGEGRNIIVRSLLVK